MIMVAWPKYHTQTPKIPSHNSVFLVWIRRDLHPLYSHFSVYSEFRLKLVCSEHAAYFMNFFKSLRNFVVFLWPWDFTA